MNIKLSDHFTYKTLIKFTLPSISMMIFTSIYSIVDGYFVSNFAGKTAFAAVNFIMPVLIMLGAVGFMFGAGGSALVSKTLGEQDKKKANSYFSLIVYTSVILGIVIAILGIIFIRPLTILLGATPNLTDDCVTYGRIILLGLPFFMLQMEFQSFFITAEKPMLGFKTTFISGITNMVLDALLVGVFDFGIPGAAFATVISQAIGALTPVIYFSKQNYSLLKLGKTNFDIKVLLKVCTNGSSELMSNISMSLVSMLYNFQLMHHSGENGVAAYGVLMYVSMIFASTFIGYSIGTAPIIGYHFGAKNHNELKNLLKRSFVIISVASAGMVILAEALAFPLSRLFVGYDYELFTLTCHGFFIYSFSFLFMGYAMFASGFFTALNDGLTSAVISFLRTLVFQVAAVLILPAVFGIDGIWYSLILSELLAVMISIIFIIIKKNKYKYW